MIEAVVNVSEGRDRGRIDEMAAACGPCLLDVHSDSHHNRSVYTLAGSPQAVEGGALELARRAIALIDMSEHEGVHPRLGAVDVVPFVPYGSPMKVALEARGRFADAVGRLGVPCFLYGPERSLPEVRKEAWHTLFPATGPSTPHPTAGGCCVGARDVLVAYNLVVDAPLERAREIARALRRPEVQALAFALGEESQVSMNLISPERVGPAQVYDEVRALAPVLRAELVGLIPGALLDEIPQSRCVELGLDGACSIESRLVSPSPRTTSP